METRSATVTAQIVMLNGVACIAIPLDSALSIVMGDGKRAQAVEPSAAPAPRRRGRPPGSRNKGRGRAGVSAAIKQQVLDYVRSHDRTSATDLTAIVSNKATTEPPKTEA